MTEYRRQVLLLINIHISFVFGVFLILLILIKFYLLDLPARNASHSEAGGRGQARPVGINRRVIFFLILSLGILLLNPQGINGILYPLNIFKNYGYTIVENQNIFYLKQVIFNPLLNYFILLIPVILLIILTSMNQFIEALLLLVFFVLTCFQWRHLPFFVLVAIPITAKVISYWLMVIRRKIQIHEFVRSLIFLVLIFLNLGGSIFFVTNQYSKIFDREDKFGIEHVESGKNATDFVLKSKLPGNIFNNFDIGGYLIYKLFPKYRVFIDNRPEAYPKEFIEDIYKKMHYEKNLQKKIFEKYNIQTIIFSHTDQTQWGEIFIEDIFKNRDWKLVYLDHSIIILTKKNIKDIRMSKFYLENLIIQENNYLNLLKLTRIFRKMNEIKLADKAMILASDLNPKSCSVNKFLYAKYLNKEELFYFKINELRKNNWYCF